MHDIDAIDGRILRTLQADGRITNADLADKVGLSPSPCLRRVKRLEQAGVVTGYGARLDRKPLGWSVLGFVSINLQHHSESDAADFMTAVAENANVIACHALAGEIDFMLQVVARDIDDYFEVMVGLGGLPGVKDIRSAIAINEVKPMTGLPVRST